MRNSIIGYFKNNNVLNYSDFISNVINNYDSVNTDFPKEAIAKKLTELPSKKGFDTQFSIVKKKIKTCLNFLRGKLKVPRIFSIFVLHNKMK
ncbi:hypothetical protein, partial [Capnocytophaga stomatis]